MVNAISCKWWILNTPRSLIMVHRIGTFCHSRIWFHFVNAYLLDVLLKFNWLKQFWLKWDTAQHFRILNRIKQPKKLLKIWHKYGEFGKYDWHSLMNERTNEWIVYVTKRQVLPNSAFSDNDERRTTLDNCQFSRHRNYSSYLLFSKAVMMTGQLLWRCKQYPQWRWRAHGIFQICILKPPPSS